MPSTRTLTTAFALSRLLFGVGLIAAPDKLSARWIGEDGERGPVQVIIRGLGARDIALSAGALACLRNDDQLAIWLAGAIVADLTDVASIFAPPASQLPDNARLGTVLLGGGAAAAGAALLARVKG